MKEPLPAQSWNFVLDSSFADTWFFCVDNPAWGNNAEASSSRGIRMPRLTLISSPHSVSSPNQNVREYINSLEPVSQIHPDQEASDGCVMDMDLDPPSRSASEVISSPPTAKKRRGRLHTPIVDDEVRRSARLRNAVTQGHI
jgi:hypothetical protein